MTKESPRDGDNPTFLRGGVRSFFRFPERMPRCSEILRRDHVDIMIKVWCSRRVQYVVHVWFFCTSNICLTPMASADPGNALSNVFCQNEYFWNCWQERLDFFFSPTVFQHQTKTIYYILLSKEATSQSKKPISPQLSGSVNYTYLFFSALVFLPSNFIEFGDGLVIFSNRIEKKKTFPATALANNLCNKPFFSALLHVKQLTCFVWGNIVVLVHCWASATSWCWQNRKTERRWVDWSWWLM